MSEPQSQKIYDQHEVNALMEKHRRGLQTTIREQSFRIVYLEDQVRQLSMLEHNPVAALILAAIRKEPAHV